MKKFSIYPSFLSTIFFLLLYSMTGKAQGNFFQVYSASTVQLSSTEQSKLTKITQKPEVVSYTYVNVNNFESALNGRIFKANLPNEPATTFEADFPYSSGPGSYYWMGYNLDGSYFQLIRRTNEVSGKIHIAATNSYSFHLQGRCW